MSIWLITVSIEATAASHKNVASIRNVDGKDDEILALSALLSIHRHNNAQGRRKRFIRQGLKAATKRRNIFW
jgi:hypothetical protein